MLLLQDGKEEAEDEEEKEGEQEEDEDEKHEEDGPMSSRARFSALTTAFSGWFVFT